MTKIEPVGYIDEFGNFEPTLLPWMQEEPGVAWEAVYKQAQMRQLGEACAALVDELDYATGSANAVRNLIKELLG